MKKNRKLIFLSILVALGLVMGLFESIIPLPFTFPGARLGLSNIVVLVSIVVFGYREGLIVALFKTLILMLVTGSVSAFFFSFAGALLSSISMILAHKYLSKYLSLIGISEIGSFFHNLGQVIVASFILGNKMIFAYLPFLLILGLFTGYFVGLASIYITKNLNTHFKELIK
ncbi:Gx transporter family protein [Peptoniphilus stercorisuis]|uniref:Heptaprenyl diphosphate synthase n=1 Tax=Peptoniphilus stercorisuis TaxID=1436965 RepID=A0ABS4KBV8_9FIRM|nr:Gx transporter family protein [Peptoniphilus stercorisuis]MBP2024741.1 heptaprenyl diphosphate synthase [Peptoniphilus stercorisuis]